MPLIKKSCTRLGLFKVNKTFKIFKKKWHLKRALRDLIWPVRSTSYCEKNVSLLCYNSHKILIRLDLNIKNYLLWPSMTFDLKSRRECYCNSWSSNSFMGSNKEKKPWTIHKTDTKMITKFEKHFRLKIQQTQHEI